MAKTIKKKSILVPKDKNELAHFVALIHRAENIIEAIEAEKSKKIAELEMQIAELKHSAQSQAAEHEKEINLLANGVHIYAEAHRAELTDHDKIKTVELLAGDRIRWYLTPGAVEIEDEEAVIAELKKKKILEAVRIKEELDKEFILKNPDVIKGLRHISIRKEEIFAITLSVMGIELQKGKRKFKKTKM